MHDINGMYVGQLSADKLKWFEAEVAAGRAWRDYDGPSGGLGLAKVKLRSSLRHKNGKPMFSSDGTLLDEKGNRSIFDDVDR